MHEQEAEAEDKQEKPIDKKAEIEESSADKIETTAGNERNPQEGRDGDTLAWLEGPAFSAPIEELPTLHWPENHAENDIRDIEPFAPGANQPVSEIAAADSQTEEPLDDLEDAMDWLEQLAAGQGTPINEMPTLVSGGRYDETTEADVIIGPDLSEITGLTSTLRDHDSDPMAWLEQLAVDQSSPLEELPSVANRLLASEIISQNDVETAMEPSLMENAPMVIEVEDALDYLEQLAISKGIVLDQVSIDQIVSGNLPDNSLNTVDQMAEVTPAAKVLAIETAASTEGPTENDWNHLSAEIPDDPDEALAWLGRLSDDDTTPDGNLEIPEDNLTGLEDNHGQNTQQVNSVSGQSARESTLGVETLDEMPDDPDEAMAWMRGLAEQQEDMQDASSGEDQRDMETLESARLALSSGDLDKATKIYQDLLESGEGGSDLITDLESAVEEQPNSADLTRLLGDAYMQDGQMQKALRTYRKGFDHP